MVDVMALTAAANSFKIAVDLAKGIHALKTSTEVREKTSALLDAVVDGRFKLLEASDTQTTLLARIKELEQQVADFENWNRDKERYQLKAIDTGAFAYMHKPGMENSEPAIWLCQTCFEKRHKSPLQYRAQDRGSGASGGRGSHSRWGCNDCKGEVVVHYHRNPAKPWPSEGDASAEPPTRVQPVPRVITGRVAPSTAPRR